MGSDGAGGTLGEVLLCWAELWFGKELWGKLWRGRADQSLSSTSLWVRGGSAHPMGDADLCRTCLGAI